MTYNQLKTLTSALLRGDNTVPNDNEFIMLVEYGLERLANRADALKLLSASSMDNRIIRNGPGNTFVRMPELPKKQDDELDIDHELGFALARYIASFLSNNKMQLHEMEAEKIIRDYNQKVQAFFEDMEAEGDIETKEPSIYGVRRY